jgi:murein DD-endopeptidase MepM/ murein hydrolase activator NlpD
MSQTGGIVLYAKEMPGKAGKSVFVLGPKWRIHEYLHLNSIDVDPFEFVKPGERIATLGKTGTAGTCNPPLRFNWRLMFRFDPSDHLPTE